MPQYDFTLPPKAKGRRNRLSLRHTLIIYVAAHAVVLTIMFYTIGAL